MHNHNLHWSSTCGRMELRACSTTAAFRRKERYEMEGSAGDTNPFETLASILAVVIGYAMWPKVSRQGTPPRGRQCPMCGNFD